MELVPCTKQCEVPVGHPINQTNANVWIQQHDYSLRDVRSRVPQMQDKDIFWFSPVPYSVI